MAKSIRTSAVAALVLLVVASIMRMEPAAASAAGDGGFVLCNMNQDELMACKPCISTSKPVEKPSETCCMALRHANLTCLCSYKNSELLPYFGIDPKLAVKLPAKCNGVQPSQC